jgi:hypothetical protein
LRVDGNAGKEERTANAGIGKKRKEQRTREARAKKNALKRPFDAEASGRLRAFALRGGTNGAFLRVARRGGFYSSRIDS